MIFLLRKQLSIVIHSSGWNWGGLDIHYVHVRGERADARPLIMTHGWPGSHFEFWGVIDRLAFPSRYGGLPEDAFDLVLPSLPGFGYSAAPPAPLGPRSIAALWHDLMTQILDYPEYLAQGGDWGAAVSTALGRHYAPSCRAIHLNLAPQAPRPPRTPEEEGWQELYDSAQARNSAYATLQMTKPLSVGWLAAGNPLGQAAWILERFHDWSDLRNSDLENVFGLEHLITNIMIYVMTGSFATSTWIYNGVVIESATMPRDRQRCETPTGFARFPCDGIMPSPPRSRVEDGYAIVHWSEQTRGGHFAAMEQPTAFAADVATWGRLVWC